MKITNSTYQPTIKSDNVNFQGMSFPRFFASPKTTITLSKEAQLNKTSLEWLNNRLKGQSQDAIKKAYNSCLNSDNNVCEQAMRVLKKYIPEKTFFGSLFSTPQKPNVYSKFGLDFMSEILEKSKNNKKNHTTENLDFLEIVLDIYDRYTTTEFFDLISKSKMKDGNVLQGTAQVFKKLYIPNSGRNYDDVKYLSFLHDIKDKNNVEKNFIIKNILKDKSLADTFDFVSLAKGNKSDKILEAVSNDLEKNDSYDIKSILRMSRNDKNEVDLDNYKRLVPYINSPNKDYYFLLKIKTEKLFLKL